MTPRLLYGLSFPMSEEAQSSDFVIPVYSTRFVVRTH